MFDGDHFLLRSSANAVLRHITREIEFRISLGS
jgi:surfactin synthase thioesterase subunit